MSDNNKVLVTGGTGFVGSHLLRQLVSRKYDAVSLHRIKVKQPIDGVEYRQFAGLECRPDWSELLTGVDTIVHCAARVHVMNETAADPLAEFRKLNLDATMAMANGAVKAGVRRFIFISSIGVIGAETTTQAFRCDTTCHPHSPYAQSKYEAEQALQQLAKDSGLEVVIIRPPLVYGPDAPGNFATLLKAVAKGLPLPFGHHRYKRSFVAVDNLCDLICHCIDNKAATKMPLVVSDGDAVSTGQLIRAIGVALGKSPLLIWFPMGLLRFALEILGKKGMAQQLCGSLEIDISQVKQQLSWSPPVSMSEALANMVASSNKSSANQ
jgi:nucleoside-diphosphate-sugar epimerase